MRLLEDVPTHDGYDRDESPRRSAAARAMTWSAAATRTWKAGVRYVPSSDNRSHGGSLGAKLADFCNGTRFKLVVRYPCRSSRAERAGADGPR